jgi:hypothetical protein
VIAAVVCRKSRVEESTDLSIVPDPVVVEAVSETSMTAVTASR